MKRQPKPKRTPYMPTPEHYLASLDASHQKKWGWKRVLLWFLLFAGIVLIASVVYIFIQLSRLSINPLDLGPLNGESDGRVNVLVLGVGDPGHAGEELSDTVMVVSIDPQTKQMAYISLPRDLRVPIPGHGYGKINQANSLGGPALAEQTVSNVLGIPINYYAKADFTGLKQAVDAVGGLQINVQQQLVDPEYPCDNNQYAVCGMKIAAGQQLMNGTTVLKYVRCRKGDCGNDFGRALRQQQVLTELKKKVTSPGVYLNLVTDNNLVTVISTQVKTDLSISQMARLAWLTKQVPPEQTTYLVFSTSPGGLLVDGPGSDLLPYGGTFTRIQSAAQNVFNQPSPVPLPNQ